MAKRVYAETVKKWAIGVGITEVVLIGLIFLYLIAVGAISNVSYSGDVICAGTIDDPCYAYINFTANEDIFIYPTNYDPWGRETLFNFDPNVKSWKLERSWGSGWRNIPLDKACTGTWCGLSNADDTRKFSIAFREGRSYRIRIVVLKNDPNDKIKWGAFTGVDEIDPIFYGVDEYKSYDSELQEVTIKDKYLEEISTIKLTTPLVYNIPAGYEKVWEYKINLFNETYKDAIKEVTLIDLNTGKTIEKQLDYKLWGKKEYVVNDYEEVCEDNLNKSGVNCSLVVSGNHIELRDDWIDFDYSLLQKGEYKIGIFTQVNIYDNVEWIPILFEQEISEWASFVQSSGTKTYIDIEGANYTVETFTSNGYFNVSGDNLNASTLVIAGGAGGGSSNAAGGGGAGGYQFSNSFNVAVGNYNVFVGAGGASQNNGSNSIFSTINSIGGGTGGDFGDPRTGHLGGSGGGGATDGVGGDSTAGQGYDGGDGYGPTNAGGGGGGASEVGVNAGNNVGGAGGDGLSSSITGTPTVRAGGGGGSAWTSGTDGAGGTGGGGAGSWTGAGTAGTANTGSGGGGGATGGGAGGSGIIIIRYLTSDASYDSAPEVTLNTPINTSNFSISSINFGGVVTDDINLINVSLIIDNIYIETNTSGLNNTNYTFTDTIADGDHIWNYEACDNSSECTNGTARTFTIDTTKPAISYNSPTDSNGSLVDRDWIYVNVTATDTHLDTVQMEFDGTNETFTTNVEADYWENKTDLSDGTYSFYAWANDTFGNYNFTANYTVEIDTTTPLIEYQGETADNLLAYNRSWIFVNVSVTELNEKNITFSLYYSNNTIVNSSTYTEARRSINWSGLIYGTYLYNVTIWDLVNKSNSTATRTIYLSDLFLYIENSQANLSVELGSLVELIANSTLDFGLIYLDVDHPSYGTNYNSSSLSVLLNVAIEWFRKTLFNNGYSTQNLTFDSVNHTLNQTTFNTTNFSVSVHQYDYINNLSVNLTGETNEGNSTTYKSQIIFYKANDADSIDRIFYGDLIGEDIYMDRVFDNSNGTDLYLNSTNTSFENEGEQLVYFYLDDNADLINFILNITGYEYGFTFDNASFGYWKDGDLSNASTIANFIFPSKTGTSNWLNYGGFNNASEWSFSLADYTYDPGGSHDEYCEEYATTKGVSSLTTYSELDGGCLYAAGESDSETITSNIQIFNYTDVLNSLSLENFTFEYTVDIAGTERYTTNFHECEWDFEISLGGEKILDDTEWDKLLDNANCYDEDLECYFTATQDIVLTVQRNPEDSDYLYNLFFNGSAYYYADFDDGVDCEWAKKWEYYDNATWYIDTDPGCGSSSSGTIGGTFKQINPSGTTTTFNAYTRIKGFFEEDGGNWGCESLTLNFSVSNSSVKLNSYENSSYVSTSIFDSSANINKVNVTVTGVFNGTTHLSGDYGENWQTVSGVENNIDNPGKNILWWQKFIPDSGYLGIVPYVSNVLILSERGIPSDVSLDFGDDGTYDYTMSGYLNGTNQTLIADLTLSDISGAFTGDPETGQTWLVPLRVFSNTSGIVKLNTINLTYDPNPVYLNVTSIQSYIDDLTNFSVLNISVGSINGTINLTDLRYDYLGGNDTIEIIAHNADYSINISRWLIVYYSSFYRLLPYTWTDDIFFLPRTNSSKNVSAYMQTSTRPILNITTTNYGGMESNLSIAVDRNYTCLNLTWSNSSTIPISGNKINTTWQDIAFNLGYLSNPQIWIWADLENCDPTDPRILVPYLNLSTVCEDCYWDGT